MVVCEKRSFKCEHVMFGSTCHVDLANNIFVFQYSRNVSQSCWIIDDERMGEASVEVIPVRILAIIIPICTFSSGNDG